MSLPTSQGATVCDRQADRHFVEKFHIYNVDLNIGVECKGTVSISGDLGGVFRAKLAYSYKYITRL
jgi:hypothetical protein